MTDEIELKLRLPALTAGKKASFTPAKIAAAFSISEAVVPQANHLISIYFDTDDEWLRQHGMALRIRQIGKKRIQTLKAPAGEVAGAQSFLELEAEINREEPDLSLIDEPLLQDQLLAANLAERLLPSFTTDFKRTTWMIEFDGAEIEIAYDRGKIVAGNKDVPINEVELELKSGKPAALFALADTALDHIPFALGHETKAARGYRLRSGKQPVAMKAQPCDLPEECDVGEAFSRIMAYYLGLLRQNEVAVVSNEDPEGIHQFRVTLRRLRSLVRAYRDLMDDLVYRYLAEELRWLQSQLGPARDFDVFLNETIEPIHHRFPDIAAIGLLAEAGEGRRLSARHAAHLTLELPRYNRLQLSLYRWLATQSWRRLSATATFGSPVADFADRLLKKQHKRLRRLGQHGDVPEEKLHELRVAGKKMRYLSDAFRSLHKAKAVKRYQQHLADIQDCLGGLNDAFVGDRLMTELIAQLAATQHLNAEDLAYLRGLVTGWQASRIEGGLQHFKQAWHAFRKTEAYWKKD